MDLHLLEAIPQLREINSSDLSKQLAIFEDYGATDLEEYMEDHGGEDLDLEDVDAIFESIKSNLPDSESFLWFTKVVRNMLSMPNDSYRSARYWELMSIIVNQVVYERNGLVPDIKRLDLNVSNALSGLLDQTEYEFATRNMEAMQSQLDSWKGRVEGWEKNERIVKELKV
jgi:hypothetical protein